MESDNLVINDEVIETEAVDEDIVDESATEEAVVEAMASMYDASESTLAVDVKKFIEELTEKGLLE